ncbi:MAG: NAD(P)H-dependent oxidoreductase [Gordonia sp. (in: high G+C Gram-positive bacteria)]
MKVTVIAGNPKPRSRTLDAAVMLAESVALQSPTAVIDVIDLKEGLLGWGDVDVRTAVDTAGHSHLLFVASPTFKATYCGVLKLFLDQFATSEGLRDVVAIPLMLGASPMHALAPELLLKPVLAELGALCPAPGLYLIDSTYSTDGRIADYANRWGESVRAFTRAHIEAGLG